jgi:hypothetical protein
VSYLKARVGCILLGLPPRPLLARLGHYFGNKAGSRRVFWFEPYCIGASYYCYIDVFFIEVVVLLMLRYYCLRNIFTEAIVFECSRYLQ